LLVRLYRPLGRGEPLFCRPAQPLGFGCEFGGGSDDVGSGDDDESGNFFVCGAVFVGDAFADAFWR
jgi:hypothetical protein